MLIRRHRFHGQKGLNDTYRRGSAVRAQQLTVKYAYRDPRKPYRVAVVVSKKVSKSAVVRNRIRRRLYEIIRRHGDKLPGGLDLVMTVYQEHVATMPAAELEQSVIQALGRLPPPPAGR